jgi:hypothetical protein
MRIRFALLVTLAVLALPRVAAAQQYLWGASGAVATGLEGGGGGASSPKLARSRLRLGIDWRVDESPNDILAAGLIVDFGTHSSFGIDARYVRPLGEKWRVNAGIIAFIAPETLFGPSLGLTYHIRLTKATALAVGPEANVFILGSDLPSGTIFWQGLLQVGIDADL